MLGRLAIGATLLGLCATANAIPIVDEVSVYERVGVWDSVDYQHNLLDNGFVPGSTIATGGSIEIEIYDDGCSVLWCLDEALPELLVVIIDGFNFDTGGLALASFSNSVQVKALATINATGLLDVTVQSLLGDFKVGKSKLTVYVDTVSVPEPATISLLGVGLLAIGFARRGRGRTRG